MRFEMAKLLKFAKERYMKPVPQPSGIVVFKEQDQALGLKTLGILRLLDILHFGRNQKVNTCVKQQLSYVHYGFPWMDEKVEITTQSQITGLPIQGEDLQKLFSKENQKIIMQDIYEKYDTWRVARGILINLISDDHVKFYL